ncbi:MAG: tRNA (adenosine(37)-N6)-threonylcarbamoyltransferase complex ATPase subunit type 1 TsaE [Bacteroidales bacterium]
MNTTPLHYTLDQLHQAAKWVIDQLAHQHVVAFYGQMGAGKTTLIKEICAQLQVINTVTSPTFALVNEYHTSTHNKIFHFDFYRIQNPTEAYDLGCHEYFDSKHLCLVEWPELAEELLPPHTLRRQIQAPTPNQRTISAI